MSIQVVNLSVSNDNVINVADSKGYTTQVRGEIAGDPNQTIGSVTIEIPGMIPQVVNVQHVNGKATFFMTVKYAELIKAANVKDGEGGQPLISLPITQPLTAPPSRPLLIRLILRHPLQTTQAFRLTASLVMTS